MRERVRLWQGERAGTRRTQFGFWVLIVVLLASTGFSDSSVANQDLQTRSAPGMSPDVDLPLPPEQPERGPGGRDYRYTSVWSDRIGDAPDGFWLFVPADSDGAPITSERLPLVIFLHGYSATNPTSYLAWINHLVLRGAIVVYPFYQLEFATDDEDSTTFLPNAEIAIRDAVKILDGNTLPAVDLDRVALIGHSAGGVLAANYAFGAAKKGLPMPTVLFFAMPGGCVGCGEVAETLQIPLETDGELLEETLAIVFVAEDDWVVREGAAKVIWEALTVVPAEQRDYVVLHTDTNGSPPLYADHLQPQTGGLFGVVDAYDWYGSWKLVDALMSCSFDEEYCEFALGDTPEQRSLGEWSDGTPVTPLTVTDDPR